MSTNRGLGKGLASLIPNRNKKSTFSLKSIGASPKKSGGVGFIPTDAISANPYQPRTVFEKKSLDGLAESIRAQGMIVPLIVTRVTDGRFELIAGERRLRAARDIGLKKVPAMVRSASEQQKFEIALIENIQREDLNPIELAGAYRRALDEFSLTQRELAKRLGRARPSIANIIRFLSLPEPIKESLANGEITEGHAKVILSVEDENAQLNLWKKITTNKLTIPAAHTEARRVQVKGHTRKVKKHDAEITALEEKLESRLGTRVAIKGNLEKGQIVLDYFSREELQGLVKRF